jgi:chromosome segregation ATPase
MRQVVQLYKPELDRIDSRQAQLDSFANELSAVEARLALKKTAFGRQLSQDMDDHEAGEFEVQQQIRQVAERREEVKAQQIKHTELVARLKQRIAQLKAEEAQVLRRIELTDSILGADFQIEAIRQLRSDVLKTAGELEQKKDEVRDTRSRVFSLQRQLADISEAEAPLQVRQVLLRSRLEGAQFDDELLDSQNALREYFLSTKQVAVGTQQLAVEKLKLQRQLNALREQIEEARAQKAELMQSILPLRAQDDAALKAIYTQIEQYQMAAKRNQKVLDGSRTSKQHSISHELDLKMEHDQIDRELADIGSQMKSVEAELSRQEAEIDALKLWLQKNPLPSEISIQFITEDGVLRELIEKIQIERDLEIQLSRPVSAISPTIYDDFGAELKQKGELRMRKIATAIQVIRQESKEIEAQIGQCQEQRAQAETARPPRILSPKAKRYQSLITGLEESVDAQQRKCERKREKLSTQKGRLSKLVNQLDPGRNRDLLRCDLCERVERSANWLLPNIRRQKKAWNDAVAQSALRQIAAEWDAKIVNAALNEADDLALRAQISSGK